MNALNNFEGCVVLFDIEFEQNRRLWRTKGLTGKKRGIPNGGGGSAWLDSVEVFLSGPWRMVDYAAVRRVD